MRPLNDLVTMPLADPEIARRVGLMLRAACPRADPVIERLLDFLATHSGVPASARAAAEALGFRSRYALARYLNRHAGLTLTGLARWTRVLGWLERARLGQPHLSRQALGDDLDPSNCRRTVKDLTGLTWHELRELGVEWAVRALSEDWKNGYLARTTGRPRRSHG